MSLDNTNPEYFVLNGTLFDDTQFAFGEQLEPIIRGDCEYCPKCGKPISLLKWLPPMHIKLSKPSYGDFVFGDFNYFLVSNTFKEQYEQSDLKGILSFEKIEGVKVSRMKANSPEPKDYYYVTPIISHMKIDYRYSTIKGQRIGTKCSLCNPRGRTNDKINGITLASEGWHGEDIFRLYELGGTVFMTKKFVDFCLSKGFTNFKFIKSEQYTF